MSPREHALDTDERETVRWLRDRAEIADVVLAFARAFDLHDWSGLRACLTATVEADYADLRGEPPQSIAADEYVATRARALDGLRTQHVSTNHLITVEGDRAECLSAFVIHRLDPRRADGQNTFDTAGHYAHGLCRTPDGWRIARIEQRVLWSRGNPDVHGALRRNAATEP
jgi:hypothetical protein